MNKKGSLIIISGPSGSGKGTIVKELIKNDNYALSISATTRAPRNMEIDGVHYFFKSQKEFERLIENNDLLEWAEFVGNYYGTPKEYVLNKLSEGKNVILEIEVRGALQVKKAFESSVLIFVIPPSVSILRERLVSRKTESIEVINKRLRKAKEEIEQVDCYDFVVVNDLLSKAVLEINEIVNNNYSVNKEKNLQIIEEFRGEIFNA